MPGVFGLLEWVVKAGTKTTNFAIKQALVGKTIGKPGMQQTVKMGITKTQTDMFHMDLSHIKIPYKEKIADLKTDHGLSKSYLDDLIKHATNTDQLKIIKSYLTSNRNDIDYNTTKRMIDSMTRTAKEMELHKHLNEQIKNMSDPLAMIQEHVHHITDWLV